MKLHERYFIVERAHNAIDKAVLDELAKHDLTYVELLVILNRIAASHLKYAIRQERHPDDPEKRGGEA